MRKIGLIGGTSPESTLLYYRHIVELSHENLPENVYPEVVIYSVNFDEIVRWMRNGDLESIADKFSRIFGWMEDIGVELGALTANAMHLVFDLIETNLELVHIVDAVIEEAKERGYEKLTLFGVGKTMESDMYPRIMENSGIEVLIPDGEDRARIDEIIFGELVLGRISEEVRKELEDLARKYLRDSDAVILGCTELPMAFEGSQLPVIDTTRVHAERIFERAVRA